MGVRSIHSFHSSGKSSYIMAARRCRGNHRLSAQICPPVSPGLGIRLPLSICVSSVSICGENLRESRCSRSPENPSRSRCANAGDELTALGGVERRLLDNDGMLARASQLRHRAGCPVSPQARRLCYDEAPRALPGDGGVAATTAPPPESHCIASAELS